MLNGDAQTGLLMHIIRFVMPSKSKPLKKLMYFFFEVCPKHDAQGKLRQEWILVWLVENLGYIARRDADCQKQCHPF
jgi:vesicle coat complex subunit